MTTHRFVLVRAGGVVRECRAPDLATARTILRPAPGEYVESLVSWELGSPRALVAGRCVRCGARPRVEGTEECAVCAARLAEERRERRQRRTNPFPERDAGARGPYKRHGHPMTGRAAEAVRQAAIKRGITHRARKRGAA